MIYQTMTRNKLLRLSGAKGWMLTGRLYIALYMENYDYYEVSYRRDMAMLDGIGYQP